MSQYSVLPPISAKTTTNNRDNNRESVRTSRTDIQQTPTIKDQEPLNRDLTSRNPLIHPVSPDFYEQSQSQPQSQQQLMMLNVDTYLPEEPVLLTDYEEERLSEQICNELGYPGAVDKIKLFYHELTTYDPNLTGYVHYSTIQSIAYHLGVISLPFSLFFTLMKYNLRY